VLIDAEGRGKLCDFGLAKTRDTTASVVSHGGGGGTAAWLAPEVRPAAAAAPRAHLPHAHADTRTTRRRCAASR